LWLDVVLFLLGLLSVVWVIYLAERLLCICLILYTNVTLGIARIPIRLWGIVRGSLRVLYVIGLVIALLTWVVVVVILKLLVASAISSTTTTSSIATPSGSFIAVILSHRIPNIHIFAKEEEISRLLYFVRRFRFMECNEAISLGLSCGTVHDDFTFCYCTILGKEVC